MNIYAHLNYKNKVISANAIAGIIPNYKKKERKEVLKLQKEANKNFFKAANLNLRKGTIPPQQPHFYMELE